WTKSWLTSVFGRGCRWRSIGGIFLCRDDLFAGGFCGRLLGSFFSEPRCAESSDVAFSERIGERVHLLCEFWAAFDLLDRPLHEIRQGNSCRCTHAIEDRCDHLWVCASEASE